jgi:hypothetical protein
MFIFIEETDPQHRWFIVVVQAQIEDFVESEVVWHIEAAHHRKISNIVRFPVAIPRSAVVPVAFSSNCFAPSFLSDLHRLLSQLDGKCSSIWAPAHRNIRCSWL